MSSKVMPGSAQEVVPQSQGSETMLVSVPAGAVGGQQIMVKTPAGDQVVTVPDGLKEGEQFGVAVPSATPVIGSIPRADGMLR